MKKEPQWKAVLAALESLGGVATLTNLYLHTLRQRVPWTTKTPEATIRRIVQTRSEFHKIQPGLYCVAARAAEFDAQYRLSSRGKSAAASVGRNHSYYQGLLSETGQRLGCQTFIPAMDKNRKFLDRPLSAVCNMTQLPADRGHSFGYPRLMARAKTVDVIWFNRRQMPAEMFEVEISTNMQTSLLKFNELCDFHTKFHIVAPRWRRGMFEKTLAMDSFHRIRKRVKFMSFEAVERRHFAAHAREVAAFSGTRRNAR